MVGYSILSIIIAMTKIVLNAHLLSHTDGYRKAGIHRYMFNVLANLPVVAPDFTYIALANHQLDLANITTVTSPFDTSQPLKRIVWEQLFQPRQLRKLKPDVYHAMAFVAPLRTPDPFVVTVYDLSFLHYPEVLSRSRRLYLSRFTAHTCQRATRIIAISQSTADDLVRTMKISPEKIDIAYPGVSDAFQPLPPADIDAFRTRENLPSRFLLFLGTLEPRKNLQTLLQAYAQLTPDERQACHLVLAGGKGWFYDEIFATIARLNLTETVHTPGYIAAESLVHWYNAATAFVYPAIYEGFGMPIVEALACGTPVIAANSSSLPEAGGAVSVLVPPDDELAWTEAIRDVLDKNDSNEARQNRQTWAARFNWQQTARDTAESYRHAQNG